MQKYAINQSPLYKLTSVRRLAKMLDFDDEVDLNKFVKICEKKNYKRFSYQKHKAKKRRFIQEPIGKLKHVHKKVSSLLGKIEPPEYLHSAVRGRSYITNARAHLINGVAKPVRVVNMDIGNFFESSELKWVKRFFRNKMKCPPDVAAVLGKLLTIDGHLPTGGNASTILSYYAYSEMFEEIHGICTKRKVVMTVYVDDLTFSGVHADKNLVSAVMRIVGKYGLSINKHKTKTYRQGNNPVITGVVLTNSGLRVRNVQRKVIHDGLEEYNTKSQLGEVGESLINTVRGRIGAASQIEKQRYASILDKFKERRTRTK